MVMQYIFEYIGKLTMGFRTRTVSNIFCTSGRDFVLKVQTIKSSAIEVGAA
jgi:hypothetical protein